MCALFGFVNYRHAVSRKHLKELVNKLASESEVRGTDASGIAYVKNGDLKIFKKAKPAHKVRFYFPDNTTILTGHTRMATQGDARYNHNNHPFLGHTTDGSFALCHNGVLYNDDMIAKMHKLPKTNIKTDSYVAAQLIEKCGHLNFDTVSQMSETVKGSFVFTLLNDDNTLYISKGDNPLCLVHFKQLGLYVYTSTTAIMKKVIKGSFLEHQKFDIIEINEGEIIRLDKNGVLTRDTFVPDCAYDGYNYFGFNRFRTGYNNQESYLYDVCNIFGVSPDDITLLYDMGYCDEEIEVMLNDEQLMKDCLEEAHMCIGECI